MNFKLQLVDDAKKWYRMYSIWFFTAAGMIPEIWNLIVQSGLIDSTQSPQALNRIIQLIALGGGIFRLVQQQVLVKESQRVQTVRAERESQLSPDQGPSGETPPPPPV